MITKRYVSLVCLAGMVLVLSGCQNAGAGSGASAQINFAVDSSFDSGTSAITGAVSFPSGTASGRALQITVQKTTSGDTYTVIDGTFTTNGASSMTYRVTNVSDGTYKIRVRVDTDGNNSLIDSGDLDGWYNGTVLSPITSSSSATEVTVSGGDATGRDFGVGAI